MPTIETLLNAFVTLFVITDPIGNAPIFLGLTVGLSTAIRRSIAVKGSFISFWILSLFAVTGTTILDTIGITVDAFRIAGGLLLFVTAFEMIYGQRQERREETTNSIDTDSATNLAVFPLAIPLLAGPGTISATILLSSELTNSTESHHWVATFSLVAVIATLMVITAALLVAADALDKYISNTGKLVLTRLLGVLLAALSVQYIADGVLAFSNQ